MSFDEKKQFDLPGILYFASGNRYTGSVGAGIENGFNYAAEPEDGTLNISIWRSPVCCELAEDKIQKEFSLTAEGIEKALQYLSDSYDLSKKEEN
ncbi:MAG: hypothetical protein LKK39_08695 [Oscillospiraceae bacterium]|jgi:hypothetical protein|nr:hypothetical protein [Oscillospiraceae bacterium]CAB1248810.1 conserved protein of unknown function [Ruminococcaceae bacterium BL-4]